MGNNSIQSLELSNLAQYLRWSVVGLEILLLVISSYIFYIACTTKINNSLEWQFTKLNLILEIVFVSSNIIYYPLYNKFPNSTWLCQIGGLICPSLFAISTVCVLILLTVRFMRYVLKINVKPWACYSVLMLSICLDLALMLYFVILEKFKPTIIGYCFIDPFEVGVPKFIGLFVLIIAGLATLVIMVNYSLLCRLGLQMGSYVNSEEFNIDKNSIIEKSMLIVIAKSLSIMLTYTITILPKIISVTILTIYQRPINPKFDLIADFLLSLNTIPNLLTIVLLNKVIRKRLIRH
ncbi:hypothetical protein CONCODRAFT_6105 [Conidiobolus coronatus NRRL 28638]|uniref:Uncharacterized protein n=1 Tax=Conidiobolus coronatus (strain ATCC 28846 / CBS 209.66 / NRRL 28638) TaxID=796925 RepID=A0A137P877_CONC2|nr:hypothetical protein CONCODRAFT_6105 [Conidiobolus coronatus NRRL 28638]|eukprot:KXN71213.1 hypothetical protein CONCODRAFT_6105 [Conidiobolus coronatus NRRL 28638]